MLDFIQILKATEPEMKVAEFHRMCPNCGRIISDKRLKAGLPCERCLPEFLKWKEREEICEAIEELQNFQQICRLDRFVKEFTEFFKEKTGFTPWSLQIMWAKRVALKKSFTMIAPTGVGKTTWGLVTSAFVKGKVYVLVPTKLLVLQTVERLKKLTDKKVVAYTGKKREKETIASGEFEILVTTTNFLYRNFEIIPKPFDFVFVDDVDSLLKSAKNVDKVIMLLGFTEEDVELAMKVIDLKAKAAKSSGRELQKLLERIKRLEKHLERRREEIDRVLVVSSATSQPRSKRVKLFRELLGFEVGKSATALRNVEDVLIFTEKDELQLAVETVKKFGKGVFLFVSADRGREYVDRVVETLNSNGIPAVSYEEFTPENQQRFVNGEIWAAVGISSYRNPLARGIDLPQAVRYALFLGVPKMEFGVKLSLSPVKLFGLLLVLRELFSEEELPKVNGYISYLKRYLTLKEELLDRYPKIKSRLQEIKEFLEAHLSNPEFLKKIRESETVSLKEKNGELVLVVGDAAGYVQASGRTSRMFAGGLTKGVSLMVVDDVKALNSLRKRVMLFLEDVEFKVLETDKGKEFAGKLGLPTITEEELKAVFKQVDRDRKRVREILEGKVTPETKSLVTTALVVVESPNKARTIANFFGKPVRRRVKDVDAYEINIGNKLLLLAASKGHVFDLTVRDGVWGVKEEDGHYIPVYDTIKYCTKCNEQTTENFCTKCEGRPDVDKITVVEALRELGLEIDEVYIASDPDTEGEKIGWDVGCNLKPYQMNMKRMEFHEITKWAFLKALEEPREIDENLVKAQIVRRVADRWVGFSLSQHLWKVFNRRWLSAGRVQTPVLGWVIERFEESKEKIGLLTVECEGVSFTFKLEEPQKLKEVKADKVKVKVREVSVTEKNPKPPFNTGELLKEAADRLKLSAERVMEVAQELFESGFITYHRTDSTRVSTAGMGVAKEFITERFGPQFVKLRPWGEGGAHECIRPTRPLDAEGLRTLVTVSGSTVKMERDHYAVYDLIFRRFIASQMVPAEVERVKAEVKLLPDELQKEEEFTTKITKDGWNLILPQIEVTELPFEPTEGESYYLPVKAVHKRLIPKVLPYTQGELVEEMRKRRIGRPSTYAKIVQTLLDRKYVVERRHRLYPTKLGIEVYNYLAENFPHYTSEEFTRELEELMDKVERGEADYQKIIEELKPVLQFANVDPKQTVGE